MTDKLVPVDVSTLQERVYQTLRQALYQGQFAPGETVTIRGLASALGTSAMPVREALQRLVAEKALIQTPSRSVKVAPFTPEMFAELIRIRMTIEGMAAGRAALNSTPALVEKLEVINTEMKAAIASGFSSVTGDVLDANRRFHFTIARATRNAAIVMVVENLWDLRYRSPLCAAMLQRAREVGVRPLIEDHREILDALTRRDPATARSAMRAHLGRVIDGLLTATELDAMERTRSDVEARRQDIARRTAI